MRATGTTPPRSESRESSEGFERGGSPGDPPFFSQTLKLDPQPQPEAAFGFLTWKAAPPSDSM